MTTSRLTSENAEAFRALRLEALTLAPTAFGSALADEADKPLEWFASALAQNTVFGSGDPLLGMAGFRPGNGARRQHVGLLWGVYVRPAARGSGLASALANAVIEHARGRVDWLYLTVVTTNATALAIYRGLGFTIYGTEPSALRFDGQDHDEHLMALDLRRTL